MLPDDDHPLKQRQRAKRNNYPHNLSMPVQRTLSWLHRAKSCQKIINSHIVFNRKTNILGCSLSWVSC
jgi:hypothetical protein